MNVIEFNPKMETESNISHFEKFRKRLSMLRKEKNLTKSELAVFLGVSDFKIISWENGKSLPNALQLRELSSFFSVSCDYLAGLTDFKNERIEISE